MFFCQKVNQYEDGFGNRPFSSAPDDLVTEVFLSFEEKKLIRNISVCFQSINIVYSLHCVYCFLNNIDISLSRLQSSGFSLVLSSP